MPATIGNPTPRWLRPENASVLDSPTTKILRKIATWTGINDPQSQVLAMATPLVPEGQEMVGPVLKAVRDRVAKTIKAYHGSPHDFDQFSLNKIGTGEGAQAYGHGLYFAENKGTAEFYKNNLASGDLRIDGKLVKASELNTGEYPRDMAAIDIATGRDSSAFGNERWQAEYRAARKALEGRVSLDQPGRMYEVQINADPEHLLDWDVPLSNQPDAVKRALGDAGIASPDNWLDAGVRGRELYNRAKRGAPVSLPLSAKTEEIFAAKRLRDAGIPGIKYLDGGSRAAGDGSHNFVIFDDSLVSILKKYGVALPVIEGLRQKASTRGGQLPATDVQQVMSQ